VDLSVSYPVTTYAHSDSRAELLGTSESHQLESDIIEEALNFNGILARDLC